MFWIEVVALHFRVLQPPAGLAVNCKTRGEESAEVPLWAVNGMAAQRSTARELICLSFTGGPRVVNAAMFDQWFTLSAASSAILSHLVNLSFSHSGCDSTCYVILFQMSQTSQPRSVRLRPSCITHFAADGAMWVATHIDMLSRVSSSSSLPSCVMSLRSVCLFWDCVCGCVLHPRKSKSRFGALSALHCFNLRHIMACSESLHAFHSPSPFPFVPRGVIR